MDSYICFNFKNDNVLGYYSAGNKRGNINWFKPNKYTIYWEFFEHYCDETDVRMRSRIFVTNEIDDICYSVRDIMLGSEPTLESKVSDFIICDIFHVTFVPFRGNSLYFNNSINLVNPIDK